MWLLKGFVLTVAVALTSTLSLDLPSVLPELENGGVHWALIVAGSNGWYNYRHQADICHAYQLLHRNGIPDERIVVMMYDDIAHNKENPHQGVIINHINGTNLYEGVPKDYTGKAVNPDVFLQVLQGHKAGLESVGSGKVIDSGPNDNVFVFFADHGAPGLIAFPVDELHASQLTSALKNMYNEKRYNKMVIYIEACESGSMFKDLPRDINIFAVSASNGKESSYACYYDEELRTYLGDVFSVTWMENSDQVSMNKETVQEQFSIVKKRVNTSHVHEFGDMSIGEMKLSAFQGPVAGKQTPAANQHHITPHTVFNFVNSVLSRDVEMHIIRKRLSSAKTIAEQDEYVMKLFNFNKQKRAIRRIFETIVRSVLGRHDLPEMVRILDTTTDIRDDQCYMDAVNAFRWSCQSYRGNEHVLGHFKAFVNLCNTELPTDLITDTIHQVCRQQDTL